MKSFDDVFCEQFKEIIVLNKSFKDITTFKIGGKIKYLVYPRTICEIKKITKLCNKHNVKFVVLGGGSNVLASDDCFDGVVIKTTEIKEIKFCGKKVVCGCGALLGSVVISAKNKNLSGMEWAVGIPGTVGGACIMNAGAFGFETFDRLNFVVVFDGKKAKKLYKKDIKFGYRTTEFQSSSIVILKAQFSLLQKSHDEIAKNIEFFVQKRAKMQKICFPNAGSVFKKPSKDLSAAEIIDRLGLKGKRFGDAMVSNFHAGFIVNLNCATCKEVQKLIAFIFDKVYNILNIKLELEIIYIP